MLNEVYKLYYVHLITPHHFYDFDGTGEIGREHTEAFPKLHKKFKNVRFADFVIFVLIK